MNGQRWLTISSASLLCLGVFLPVAAEPFVGTSSFFQLGWFSGLALLVLGVMSLRYAWSGQYRLLQYTGGTSFLLVLVKFLMYSARVSDLDEALVKAQLPRTVPAELIVKSIGAQWGWFPLFGAALLLIIAGFALARPSNPAV